MKTSLAALALFAATFGRAEENPDEYFPDGPRRLRRITWWETTEAPPAETTEAPPGITTDSPPRETTEAPPNAPYFPLEYIGESENGDEGFPLDMCQGDCDSDADCQVNGGLRSSQ